MKQPYGIGLVGGVASGKSYVARLLCDMGGVMIDADQLGHQVLTRPLVARRLGQLFGSQILAADGTVDRQKLAGRVFGDHALALAARRQLEEVVHPLIHAAAVHALRGYREQPEPPKLVVIDAPLLLEAGWAPLCDIIIFVDTPDAVRMARALKRGWSAQQWKDREAAQMQLDQKRRMSTHILVSEPPDQLQIRLRRMVEELEHQRH